MNWTKVKYESAKKIWKRMDLSVMSGVLVTGMHLKISFQPYFFLNQFLTVSAKIQEKLLKLYKLVIIKHHLRITLIKRS